MMTAPDHARIAVCVGAALWLLVLLLAWLLLPLLLAPAGVLAVLWYAAGWVPMLIVYVVPFGIASAFKSKLVG